MQTHSVWDTSQSIDLTKTWRIHSCHTARINSFKCVLLGQHVYQIIVSIRFVVLLCFNITPLLTSAHKVKKKRLSQHHLASSQHAAPATIRGQRGAGQRGELLPVCQPNSGPKVPAEILHITHNIFVIRGLTAGFCQTFILWNKQVTRGLIFTNCTYFCAANKASRWVVDVFFFFTIPSALKW